MRCALLGNHPDGVSMADALVASGRHQLVAYAGPAAALETLRQHSPDVKPIGDLEEILADPAVEAVIVAGRPGDRAVQLRRALQSERHVFCVHPADQTPDTAYEAALIQADTKRVLLPLLIGALQPSIGRLTALCQAAGPLGKLGLIVMEQAADGPVLLDADVPGFKPALPCWVYLRALGAEIAEVSAFAAGEALPPNDPVLLAGRFEAGGLFQVTLQPNRPLAREIIHIHAAKGTAQLSIHPTDGTATLVWNDWAGEQRTEIIQRQSPWPALVDAFDSRVVNPQLSRYPQWNDEIRCLELDDAARRSIERRRASTLEYQEVTEEVGFKGTMTLAGCALLWTLLALVVVVAVWDERRLLYLVIPVLVVFLGMQLLRWMIPQRAAEPRRDEPVARQ